MDLPGYYEFCCRVKIIAGHDALEKIPGALAGLQARRPMIVTDQGVSGAGLIDIVTQAVKGRITIGSIADDVPPDSDLRVVNRLAQVYREKGCDSLIAVGGGNAGDLRDLGVHVAAHVRHREACTGEVLDRAHGGAGRADLLRQ